VLNTRLTADSKDFGIRLVLADFYLGQKKYDPAIAEYTRLVAERPTNTDLRKFLDTSVTPSGCRL